VGSKLKYMYSEKSLLKAISESFQKYIKHGARSTEKLKPIHNYIADTLKNIWGTNFTVYYMGNDSKEMTVRGKYYDKDIDITITKDDKPVMCLGIKFVTSNYKQNANNYFENMMGETANIQARKDLPYFQLIILRHQTPYYKKTTQKSGSKEPTKIEIIDEHDLQKYINLAYDTPQAHKPYAMGILMINIDENTYKVKALETKDVFDKDFAKLMDSKLSVKNLFSEIDNYKKYFLTKR
jgi:hypothetical protein